MRIRWTIPAADDLERICDFIAEERPQSAKRVAQEIVDAVKTSALSRIAADRGTLRQPANSF